MYLPPEPELFVTISQCSHELIKNIMFFHCVEQELVGFSVKYQKVNVLGFVGHVGSATATPPCYCIAEEARDNT